MCCKKKSTEMCSFCHKYIGGHDDYWANHIAGMEPKEKYEGLKKIKTES